MYQGNCWYMYPCVYPLSALTQFPFFMLKIKLEKKLLFSRLSPLWHDMMTWSIKNALTNAFSTRERKILHSSITLKQGIYPIVKKRFAWQYTIHTPYNAHYAVHILWCLFRTADPNISDSRDIIKFHFLFLTAQITLFRLGQRRRKQHDATEEEK